MKKVVSLVLALIITASLLCVGTSAKSAELTLEETLYSGFSNFEEEIYVGDYHLTVEEFARAYSDTFHLYPSAFHVNNRFSYSYYIENGQIYVYSAFPQYTVTREEYNKQLYSFNFWIGEIAGKIDSNASDLEKVLFAHEYFMAHFEYDMRLYSNDPEINSQTIYDAYNFFKYKTGVCQAYTLAFTAVMQRLGVFCTAAIDEPDNHCWNIVKIGENYYHIDTTHDDEVYTFNGCGMADHCKRDHLLLTDDTMLTLAQHQGGWYTVGGDFKCLDNSYENRIWDKYEHPTVFYNNNWYQVECGNLQGGSWTADIYHLLENGKKEVIYSFKTPAWWYTGTEYLKFLDAYAIGYEIYGSSGNNIWKYNLKTGEFKNVINLDNYIVESAYLGGGKIRVVVYTDKGLSVQYEQLLIGDSDDNGSVDGNDIVSLKKYLLLHESDKNVGFMDLNGDCFVDILDFIAINKAVI